MNLENRTRFTDLETELTVAWGRGRMEGMEKSLGWTCTHC